MKQNENLAYTIQTLWRFDFELRPKSESISSSKSRLKFNIFKRPPRSMCRSIDFAAIKLIQRFALDSDVNIILLKVKAITFNTKAKDIVKENARTDD